VIQSPAPVVGATRRNRHLIRPPATLLRAVVVYGLLLAFTAFVLFPISWMLTAALKPDTAPIFTVPVEWLPTRYFRWQTFVDALLDPDKPYLLHAFNTMILVLINVTGAVVSNSLVAYPFARLRFRGRNLLFAVLIGTLLLPGPVLLIPQFLLFYNFGWYGTYLPLTVPSFTGNAFFIFLLRQYMRRIPPELDEAAKLDGAGYWTIYRRIILPLSAPALTVVAVFTFLGTWNDFFGPLIYLDDPNRFPLAVALATNYSKVGTQWNTLMAANLVSIVPPLVVYFIAQKRLIGGIASVGLKG
jgi:ABC-type glycerol-3-phosphate transport system permease component